jgi:hypothetical protein
MATTYLAANGQAVEVRRDVAPKRLEPRPPADTLPPEEPTPTERSPAPARDGRRHPVKVLPPVSREVLEAGRRVYPPGEYERPRTRSECAAWRAACVSCDGSGFDGPPPQGAAPGADEGPACTRCQGTGLEFVRADPRGRLRVERYSPQALLRVVPGKGRVGADGRMLPCRFVTCAHHTAFEVNHTGSIWDQRAGLEVEELPDTCALDVAERGPRTLEQVAEVYQTSRQRILQIEEVAMAKLTAQSDRLRDLLDDDMPRTRLEWAPRGER